MSRAGWIKHLAAFATVLTFVLIVFGAFVRLSDAGLACPDWPTCYGKATWPMAQHEVDQANADYTRPVEMHKAWREQVHRHIAAVLGLLVLGMTLLSVWRVRLGKTSVLLASGAIVFAVVLYIKQQANWAGALAAVTELFLLIQAWRWSKNDDTAAPSGLLALLLAVVIFQALLGMWTVTWLVKPTVVTAHLLGGLLTLALLIWLSAKVWRWPEVSVGVKRPMLWVGLVLIVVQICLGGWTSTNYAAMACGTDWPKCLDQWHPPTDFADAFVLWRGLGVDYEFGVLSHPARVAIHLTHRWFAWLVAGHILALAVMLWRKAKQPKWALILAGLLVTQIALGVSVVVFGLPLPLAVSHNAVAALLLACMVRLLWRPNAQS